MVVPLHMGWRRVLFANWPVDPEDVAERIPNRLAVDTYDGTAWLTIFPFRNVDVRPTFMPRRAGIGLPEVNLRTYVTYRDRPGIFFFSLDAAGLASVLGARLTHWLPYYYADIDIEVGNEHVDFRSRRRHPGARPACLSVEYTPTGDRFKAEPDTLAWFLAERYRLFSETPSGGMRRVEVTHAPWPLQEATATIHDNTLFEANGFPQPASTPVFYYSHGVDTVVSPRRLA